MELIRTATTADAAQIRHIYEPYCHMSSAVSFEFEPPSVQEMELRIDSILPDLPWLVYEDGGCIIGYAYASPHRARAAYKWSVDVSVYIHENAHRRGIGKKLYERLFSILRQLGYFNAYAGITLPNAASEKLHENFGFEVVGVYKNVGYKGGACRDVAWLGVQLQDHVFNPPQPIAYLSVAS